MAQSEMELENQLMEAGKGILSPPSSTTELLSLLDRVENFLTRVEQSPSESMKKALSPSMKALITDDLLRHSDMNVRVAVASCISEITRITAPDAPYEDDQMKEVFQLIVSSFERLDDTLSPSYIRKTSILETVAKVRSCVVMLDLECDALIVEMFQHFLKSIREIHPENVFSSMETIMTLVLEESEDISLDLVYTILDFLKTDDEVQPVARQLGEKVIEKCASKLKPYMLLAVKSRGASLGDYSKVVANICQTGPEAVEPSDVDTGSKNLADESDLANAPPEKADEVAMETLEDAPPSEEVGPTMVGSPKSVMSNGTLQKEIEDTSAGRSNSEDVHHDSHDPDETDAEPSKTDAETPEAKEPTKPQTKASRSNKRKGRKTSAFKSSSGPSKPSSTDDTKDAVKMPEHEEKDSKGVSSANGEDPVADALEPAENEKEPDASLPKTSENEPADVPSSSPSEIIAEEVRSKKVEHGKKNSDSDQESTPADNDYSKEESDVKASEGTGVSESKKESDTKKASEGSGASESKKESNLKKASEGAGASVSKSHKRSGKKASSASDKEDRIPSPDDASDVEDERTLEDVKSAKQSGTKVETVSSQREDKKKKGQVKGTPAKDLAKTPSKDGGKNKSAAKSNKEETDTEKASKSSLKRKQSPSSEKASGTKEYGPELIGSKVKVWWPKDKKFYRGVVNSFDPVKMKHTIFYNDGDVEHLKLVKQKWELIDDDSAADEEDTSGGENPEEAFETPKAKKAKTSANQGSKRGKTQTTPEKAGASSSKSKAASKSGKPDGKSKEGLTKSTSKSKDQKHGNKSSEETPKSIGKLKEDDGKTSKSGGSKQKKDTPKVAAKSKGKSPKTAGKSNSSNTGKAKDTVSSKDEETEEDEEMSPEPAKAPETTKGKSPSTSKSQKSAKKRKRGSKS